MKDLFASSRGEAIISMTIMTPKKAVPLRATLIFKLLQVAAFSSDKTRDVSMVFARAYMFVYNVRVRVRVLAGVALLCVRIYIRTSYKSLSLVCI